MAELTTKDDHDNAKSLSLELNKKAFADIIINFLGKKEKLEYKDDINFLVEQNDIEQFYYLLEQKLEKEQNIFIDHFLVSYLYNDKTKRNISGIKALQMFNETRDVLPISITLTWNVVIRFPNAENIETQIIEVTFSTNAKEENIAYGKVRLSIQHTNQAWGNEVLNLFKDMIFNLRQIESRQFRFAKIIYTNIFENKNSILAYSMYSMFCMTVLVFSLGEDVSYSAGYLELVKYMHQTSKTTEIESTIIAIKHLGYNELELYKNEILDDTELKKKLDVVLDDKREHEQILWFFWVMGGGFLIIALVHWYIKKMLRYFGNSCYILTTKKAVSQFQFEKTQKSMTRFYSLTFFFVSILCGVSASMVYELLNHLY